MGSKPSAIRAARRAAAGDDPPRTIGGRGRRCGRSATSAGPAVVIERLAGPCLLQDLDAFLDEQGPVGEGAPEHRELGLDVPRGDDQLEPSPADDVDDRRVLRDPQRIVQGQDERSHPDPDVAGTRGRGGGHHERRRTVSVVAAVMLEKPYAVQSGGVGPGAHVERRGVQIGRVGAERGSAQIELQAELHRLTPQFATARRPPGAAGLDLRDPDGKPPPAVRAAQQLVAVPAERVHHALAVHVVEPEEVTDRRRALAVDGDERIGDQVLVEALGARVCPAANAASSSRPS